MMDVEYLCRRLRLERRLARRAKTMEAIAAHRQLADMYAAKLAALGDSDRPDFWFTRLWKFH